MMTNYPQRAKAYVLGIRDHHPLRYKLASRQARKALTTPRIIAFHPHLPSNHTVLYKLCHLLGATMVLASDTSSYQLAIRFEDTTYGRQDAILDHLIRTGTVLNARCTDISKTHVDAVFTQVFGYSLMVDPLTWNGPCVVKSDENAQHNGKIIQCPLEQSESNRVYQRVIDNTQDAFIEDLRVPIIKSVCSFAYRKQRPVATRFSNVNSTASLAGIDTLFSDDEITHINHFAETIGLDYGELDILRDRQDHRIFIVDVNNTPYGPPNGLPYRQQHQALRLLAETFEHHYLGIPT